MVGKLLVESIESCVSCKHFRSFYEEYDFDELEPRWCGRCLNELRETISDTDLTGDVYGNDIDYADEDTICELWEK